MLADIEGLIKESLGHSPSALLMMGAGEEGAAVLASVPPSLLQALEVCVCVCVCMCACVCACRVCVHVRSGLMLYLSSGDK